MRTPRSILCHPAAFGGLAVALAGWAAYAFLRDPWPPHLGPPPSVPPGMRRVLPRPPEDGVESGPDPRHAARVIPTLKIGTNRADVDRLVGPAAARHVGPATVAGAGVTYPVAYEVDPAVAREDEGRPFEPARVPPARVPPALATLEFDATRVGHPLVAVRYPDAQP